MNAVETITFDYAALDTETRIVVQQKTSEIRERMRRAAQDVVEIGDRLIDVHARLPAGTWEAWLGAEFDWSDQTARRFIHVARQFSGKQQIVAFAPSALYALAAPSIPEDAREEALTRASNGETITHKAARQIVERHRPAPARTFDQAEMFDAPPANPNYSDVAPPALRTAPFWATLTVAHPTAHYWTEAHHNEYHAACGMRAYHGLVENANAGHCSSCVRATWPQNQAESAPVGTPATAAACVRCGSPRGEHRHLTSYETDLVPEYPGRSVTLCSRCIPEMLAERKQALARLDEQLPPALFKAGYFWKLAAPPTIAHYDGWHGDAPTVESALQLGRDHLRKKTENDPRMQAAQLLKQLEPLLLALSAPDQEQLSQTISDLNECEEGSEVRHWLRVGYALLDLESEGSE